MLTSLWGRGEKEIGSKLFLVNISSDGSEMPKVVNSWPDPRQQHSDPDLTIVALQALYFVFWIQIRNRNAHPGSSYKNS